MLQTKRKGEEHNNPKREFSIQYGSRIFPRDRTRICI